MTHDNNTNDTFECHLWPKDPHRCRVILYVQRTFSSLSLLGCIVVVLLIIILKKYKSTIQKLILWLSVSGLLRSLALLLKNIHERNMSYCRFKGFIHNYFSWAILLWVSMITVNCLLIVKKKPYKQYCKWYHVIVWIGSMVWAIIPFFKDSYGQAGIWCWIRRDTGARFGLWYGPLFVLCFCMFSINVYLIWFLMKFHKHVNDRSVEGKMSQKNMRKELKSLLVYPFIYILFSIPIFIYRLDDAAHPHISPNYGLAVAGVVLTPSLGAVYAVAFVLINANLKEISIPLIKEGLRDIFSKILQPVVTSNYPVSSVTTTNARPSQHHPYV